MTDNDLKYLYQQAYCAKEAGAWDDFMNWLRQLFGGQRKNTTGENVAAVGAGIAGTGALGYGGYKGYHKLRDAEKAINYYGANIPRRMDNFADRYVREAAKKNKAILNDIALQNKTWHEGRKLFESRKALSELGFSKNLAKGMGFLKKLPKGGKWAILGGLAAGGGALAGKAYDSIFNG